MQNKEKQPNHQSPFSGKYRMYWIYGIIALIFLGLQFNSIDQLKEIDESEFLKKVEDNQVESVHFWKNIGEAEVYLKDNSLEKPDMMFSWGSYEDIIEKIIEIIAGLISPTYCSDSLIKLLFAKKFLKIDKQLSLGFLAQ